MENAETNTDSDDVMFIFRQCTLPSYGPQLPHPSEYLISDAKIEGTQLNEKLNHHITRLLGSYSIDINHGFLPSADPLPQLSLSGKFACWELMMMDITGYLYAENVRSAILSRLTVVEVEENDLLDERELQRAMLVLSILSHAFVWGEIPISTYIPACLAVPWVEVAKRVGRPPILAHASIVLSNWKRFQIAKPIELGNIALLNCFLSGIDEANFYLVTIELECRGAKALKHMLRAQYFANQENIQELINELESILAIQKTVLATFSKMLDKVDPYIFYNRVRNFISGWKDNPSLPEGMLYEGVTKTPQQLHGASAAQSTLIASFDVFFNVKHDNERTREFISDMRYYMPRQHRQFLDMLGSYGDTIGNFIKTIKSSRDDQVANELFCTYNACVNELVAFRNKHIQVVTLYILIQMHKTNGGIQQEVKHENDRTVSNEDENRIKGDTTTSSARGTGGTILMPFLKTCRDETTAQRLN